MINFQPGAFQKAFCLVNTTPDATNKQIVTARDCVRLECLDEGVCLSAFSHESRIVVRIPDRDATILKPTTLLLPRMTVDRINSVNEGQPVTISIRDEYRSATLLFDDATYGAGIDPRKARLDHFPDSLTREHIEIDQGCTVSAGALCTMLKAVGKIRTDAGDANTGGTWIGTTPTSVYAKGFNLGSLAVSSLDMGTGLDESSEFLIHPRAVKQLIQLCEISPDEVISLGTSESNHWIFAGENWWLQVGEIEGKLPDMTEMFDSEPKHGVITLPSIDVFRNAIEQVNIITTSKFRHVYIVSRPDHTSPLVLYHNSINGRCTVDPINGLESLIGMQPFRLCYDCRSIKRLITPIPSDEEVTIFISEFRDVLVIESRTLKAYLSPLDMGDVKEEFHLSALGV